MRLNLGCGDFKIDGWVNVDKYGHFGADVVHDLEQFPWPFDDETAEEVLLNHVLEHLGQDTDVFLGIMKELYRVCRAGAAVRIHVPHPRHDDFITDPTHVRAILPDTLAMFDLEVNERWRAEKAANTQLAIYTRTDFKMLSATVTPDDRFKDASGNVLVSIEELLEKARVELNVIKEYQITLEVRK
ncbi:MAG: hypothetical protein HOO19_10760 [Rhodospirillaceae bacterium]|jgi:hypothetical protein|nr:hypothetical protein [Rhodospirillaceae bacterium]MBT3887276.1 hypothetical protein [Rhodospirillaceae bacterium]MBT4117644.1 hypothetical protein [Rhodospirillaceae bacterium]MBT4670785.1 hypothetical protein [Rhodospirillaceae bacterium]MBT4749802.1 hypothetical protein [Rhodospirillaceae bacterium]